MDSRTASPRITFTFDLEDQRTSSRQERRYPAATRKVLDLLDQKGIKGSFFVVGQLAKDDPGLVKEITTRGHELGLYSFCHRPLDQETPARFRAETREGKGLLEDLSGRNVLGFRAPVFSLVPSTLWAVDVLAELGFGYSSSVMPAANPLYGFPQAPNGPFRYPNGLLELPVPVARFGPFKIPFSGGVYLRYLPLTLYRFLLRRAPFQGLWLYCHPYEFDPEEPFFRLKGAGLVTSLILWFNRSRTLAKVARVLETGTAPPLGSRLATGEFEEAEVLDPGLWPSRPGSGNKTGR